ncbi:MAG TPA: alpha/beta hydrolase [Alphaproteobacteria bacterium]|nr:alpha/beta hydrolase [Alphaproteobacteria bacterium]MDP6269103.1 alpha/beta hydrolase [Alphaproteobacteria bacterium]HJM51284.1 alpha/beta hydrolase [Alphaproteobacteria bacterium]
MSIDCTPSLTSPSPVLPLEPPAPLESFELMMDDGAQIRLRRHGRAGGARLFVSHGNGFASDGYFPFWRLLLDRFEVIVFDQRNHGLNPLHAGAHDFPRFARDLEAIIAAVDERLGPGTNIGAFHSLSALAAMMHAADFGWRWDALFLFDPPLPPLPGHEVYEAAAATQRKLAAWATARRTRFDDPGELAEVFAGTRANRSWQPGAHDLMARSVLRLDVSAGEWRLVCRPEREAAVYLDVTPTTFAYRIDRYGGPAKMICGDPEMPSPAVTALSNAALHAEFGYPYEVVPGTGHLLQLEKPDVCVDIMTRFLEERGVAF